ncbi:iron-regulated protein A, partial [Vibrio cholerae O1]|nr:iron-regulated protein A [Vibrio cholerae O1]
MTLLALSLPAAGQSAPDKEHPSQPVFELERESAHLLAEQTKQLQQRMAHSCQAPTTDISALKQDWQASR